MIDFVDFLKRKEEHFIMKYVVKAKHLKHEAGSAYQCFYKDSGRGRWSPKEHEYNNLRYFDLTPEQITKFREIHEEHYIEVLNNSHGKIFEPKGIGFDKTGIKKKA